MAHVRSNCAVKHIGVAMRASCWLKLTHLNHKGEASLIS